MNQLALLKECAQKIAEKALPLVAKPEAAKTYGRGAGGDQMKKIDLIAEKALIEVLEENNASCTLISEESGTKKIGSEPSEYYLTTDPIDGTTNAVRGLPFVATSLATSRTKNISDIDTALVSDILHNVTYTATRGQGAHRNGQKIKPSIISSLKETVIGIDLGTPKSKESIPNFVALLQKTKHLRHLGANALEICYVADGTTDAFIDVRGKLRVTDVAAAYLILLEAGGTMTTPEGKGLDVPLTPTQTVSFIATANKQLHEVVASLLV
ncbi:MAG: inositol monophosphatase family protein [Candidatus Bathyarchaeia archaeon]